MNISYRRFHRHPVFAKAVIRSRNMGDTDELDSQVNNISQGGMGVYTELPLMESTPVTVEISFTSYDNLVIRHILEGSVVSLTKQDDQYFMNIAFDKTISHEDFMKMFQLEY